VFEDSAEVIARNRPTRQFSHQEALLVAGLARGGDAGAA